MTRYHVNMTDIDEKLARYALEAKQAMYEVGEGLIPDELIMRATVAYGMLERRGWIKLCDDPHDAAVERACAICFIAHNFEDHPPSTPQRAALFAHVIEA